jgi:hypothetical protein
MELSPVVNMQTGDSFSIDKLKIYISIQSKFGWEIQLMG